METKKQKVAKLLRSRRWYTSTIINETAESDNGTRRARELREDGLDIIIRTNTETGETEYRNAGPVNA